MPHDTTRHYALAPIEAEIIACFRLLDDPTRNAIIAVITSQTMPQRQKLDTIVKLSLVKA